MDNNPDYVARAMGIATMVHAGQVDKLGKPYLHHVLRVYTRLMWDETYGTVALLHDVLEDSNGMVDYWKLTKIFPEDVALVVQLLTRKQGDSYLGHYIPRIVASNSWAAKVVKKADLEDNLSRMDDLEVASYQTAKRLRSRYLKALELLS